MKLFLAASVYIIAFVAHLFPVYALSQKESYSEWQHMLHYFRGSPFPGTDLLVLTLRAWWVYPMLSAAVFAYWLLIRKQLAASVAFMIMVALMLWIYYYGPILTMGRVI